MACLNDKWSRLKECAERMVTVAESYVSGKSQISSEEFQKKMTKLGDEFQRIRNEYN